MAKRRSPATDPRKAPKQARSERLVAAILQAAIRVLERHGASGFTTARVAERAGVSVGSLYQYFPNKQSILFRLQQDDGEATAQLLDGIFSDQQRSATERLKGAVLAFFRSEWDEAPLRRALEDAAPLYRDAPAAREHRDRGLPLLLALLGEAAPGLSAQKRASLAELYVPVLSGLGKHISEHAQSRSEVDAWAATVADMFLAYLSGQKRR
ncbi:MAG TPA: TetR family transcriptional regulator [Polyangiaceae bacterium]|nr:TetR family transcriptional regulator [Polyangiaceae bacterium]